MDIEIPKPVRREVHRDSGHWARGSGSWSFTIFEREFPNLLFINGNVTGAPDSEWVMHDSFTGLIALRVSQGWSLISADSTSATLRKEE